MLEYISVNTQNSIRIDTGCGVIYCDPFEIDEVKQDAKLICITHPHFDHFSPESIAKIATGETIFVCPACMTADVKALNIADEKILGVVPGDQLTAADIPVTVVPAYNTKKPFHAKENNWVGYIITVNEQRIYIAGDTNFIPEQNEIDCGIAILPIGGYYTMDAREAAACVNAMAPKAVIPTHYGTIVGHPTEGALFEKFVNDGIDVVFKLFVG